MVSVPTLITALGSWTIIPIALVKLKHAGISIKNLLIICTDNLQMQASREKVIACTKELFPDLVIEFFIVSGVADFLCDDDVLRCRSVIFSALAKVALNKENYVCIAGGRKSMSSDLQFAASFFGARRVFHLLEPEGLSGGKSHFVEVEKNLVELKFEEFQLLTMDFRLIDMPPFPRSTGYEIRAQEFQDMASGIFSPECGTSLLLNVALWPFQDTMRNLLDRAIRTLEDTASLMMNFHSASPPPWNSLYLLSPTLFRKLENTAVGESSRRELEPLLNKLPKAELHCHIGGILDIDAQMRVGLELWSDSSSEEKNAATDWVAANAAFLFTPEFTERWQSPSKFPSLSAIIRSSGEIRPLVCAALLVGNSRENLIELLWPKNLERRGVAQRYGFSCYEEPGELSGSALLKDRRSLRSYAREIVAFARHNGLRILELRCSPAKYVGRGKFGFREQLEFVSMLKSDLDVALRELEHAAFKTRIGIILICDRRSPSDFAATIDTLLRIHSQPELDYLRPFVIGVDVAGDENAAMDSFAIAEALSRIREKSLHTTIHAGETAQGGAVWSAIHMFSADRVGHALTLLEDPANGENLVRKLKERRIALELCPTSNIEVVGYGPHRAEENFKEYPLLSYMEKNLKVTLCTDNPGISRTSPANEFFVASSLLRRPLTLLECLRIIKNSFSASFLPTDELSGIMREVDQRIFNTLSSELNELV